jgi:hypothetical protein
MVHLSFCLPLVRRKYCPNFVKLTYAHSYYHQCGASNSISSSYFHSIRWFIELKKNSTSFFSKKLCMVPNFLCSSYICPVVRPLSTTLESKPSTLLKCDLHIGIFVIEIQGEVFHGLDYHLNECALDDIKQCPQHLNTCTSVSQKT